MEDDIVCITCDWAGDPSELVSESDAIEDPCNKCPRCGSNDIEDFE